MKDSDYTGMLCNQIARCKTSKDWNNSIAARVFAEKKRRKKRVIYSSSAATAAAAAVISVILTIGLTEKNGQDNYSRFISSQVSGTYNAVFNGNGTSSANNASSDTVLYSDDIDALIDTALSMR